MKSLSLRWRLLFVNGLLILIIVLSWFLLQKFERDIDKKHIKEIKQQSESLSVIANQVIENDPLIVEKFNKSGQEKRFPVAKVETAILIDGFSDEWYPYAESSRKIQNFAQEAQLTLVEDNDYLYGFFKVEDNSIVYRRSLTLFNLSDRVVLQTGSNHMEFIPLAPGKVPALKRTQEGLKPVLSVYAVWQEDTEGYQLEFRIPRALVGDSVSAEIHDVDTSDKQLFLQGIYSLTGFQHIKLDSELKADLFERLSSDHYRVSMTNTQGDVIYQYGSLFSQVRSNWRNDLWIEKEQLEGLDSIVGKKRLSNHQLDSSLEGNKATQTYYENTLPSITRISYPIFHNQNVIGVLLVESSAIDEKLQLRDFWLRFIVIGLLIGVLIFFVTYRVTGQYTKRIKRLRDEMELATSQEGQFNFLITNDEEFDDEVSDLNNSFFYVASRLQEYHEYQEKLVARLNHELRTPIAIVRSSLDNLSLSELCDDDQLLLNNAQSGVVRLSRTLTRLSEANRLEQAIKTAPREVFVVNELLNEVVQSYALNWPDHQFDIELLAAPSSIKGNKELFIQMLDKLIANAVDFDDKQSAIRVTLEIQDKVLLLTVSNSGPCIDKKNLKNIFNLMHSSRKNGHEHLGLGLYLARLIASYHGAKISAFNRKSPKGVSICIKWKNKYFTKDK